MSSKTLRTILENWSGELVDSDSPLVLPFNIEKVCRDIDFEISSRDDEISMLRFTLKEIKDSIARTESVHADR